ncbi:Hypothetical predicted protein [Mytilus galloprovincialis]|uniref:B30.2/SPRY domain-containing protein n=1 Tax=Mytilus galloprovincialis TaxID=29158 RepID=A0A8B6E7E5_MYTGA|nr:Hypothetical predicted protein [Mytilus galloprovincialis]
MIIGNKRHFSDMDMVGQNAYASLCAAKEKLETFNTQKNDRIHFMSMDMESEECLNSVYDKMTEVLDCRKHHQEMRYKIAEKFEKYLSVVLETVKKNEVIDISSGLKESFDITGAEFLSIAKLLQEQSTLLLKILQDYCGLVELPRWRLKPEDEQFIYVVQEKLEKLVVSLDTFYSEKKPSNFVVMEKSYKFIYPVAKEVLPGVVSSAAKYGRPLLVTADGAVFQIGCVQTVVKTLNWAGDNREIVVQTKCYLPDLKTEPVNDETEFYVKEYTWNIFCLYTDMIEKVLKQRDLIYLESGDVPNDFVHNSFGCKHVWKKVDSMFNQSVCSMCNRCCGLGRKCKYNGIMGDNFRECLCKTSLPGCVDCGICTDCANDLWELRSYLRPQVYCNSKRVVSSPSTYMESILNKVPLDPLAYNEVELVYNTEGKKGLLLRDAEDGAIVSVFPGKATALSSADIVSNSKIVEKFKTLIKDVEDPLYDCKHGDCRIIGKGGELDMTAIKESKVVYQPIISRDLKTSHETGLLCYEPKSTSSPVAQFIGVECFSENIKKFSYKIIHEGKSRFIGIGVAPRDYAPNRMPGWNPTSYGYHADDGGIYTGKSSSNTKFARCYKGDIMSVYCDTEAKDIKFYKNDKMIYKVPEEMITVPPNGFYPMVSLHSAGECVKLLEKEPWTLRSNRTFSNSWKWSYDTYKYGNMWISPRKNLLMTPKDKTDFLTGWVILHNPTKGLIGYQVIKTISQSKRVISLAYFSTYTYKLKLIVSPEDEEVVIEWIAINKIKEYDTDDIKQLFTETHENRKYSHKLKVKKDGKASTTETLPTFNETEDNDGYKLDVIKNNTLVNSYVLKKGRYCIEVAKIDGFDEYLMKRPKCPSYMYPPILKRGLKVITCAQDEGSESIRYEEKVISRVQEDGTIEYLSSKDDDEDEDSLEPSKCTLLTDQAYKDLQNLRREKKEAGDIAMYSGTKEQHRLEKTFVPAPPFLITKGSSSALDLADNEWKIKAIFAHSSCCQVITRPSVQEQIITLHSRHLQEWSSIRSTNFEMPYSLVYLPSGLDDVTLRYPVAMTMFDDVNVHRLCYMHEDNELGINNIHPTVAYPKVKIEYSNDNLQSVLHLQIPPQMKMLNENKGKWSKQQIETLLFQLLQPYASLCGLFATQHGGLSSQGAPGDLIDWIADLVRDDVPMKQVRSGMTAEEPLFMEYGHVLACRAHAYSRGDYVPIPDYSLESSYYEPYEQFAETLTVQSQNLKILPSNLWTTFRNLRVMSIVNVDLDNTHIFPSGLSKCCNLEVLILANLKGITDLPKDIISGPVMTTFFIHNCPIRKLEFDWPVKNKLINLTLKGLLIEDIPANIGRLKDLEELCLDYNPITSLPKEIENLTKLKFLSVKGIPWIASDGKLEQMPKQVYTMWHTENPYVKNNIGEAEVDRLFSECDVNNNDILEKSELARLNLQIMNKIPRLGCQSIGDTENGGIPAGVFKLTLLQTLDLSFTAVTQLPMMIREILTLQTINLEHCPLLESLDGDVGLLPNLRSLNLNSCAALETPPRDIVNRGFDSVKAFLQKMAGGFTECLRTKLMFIGLGQAGKTTLLRALQATNKKYTGSIPKLTDGIVIKDWMVPIDQEGNKSIRFSCWDFAGQTVYYNTHQIPMPDIREDELRKKYPQIRKFCYVSSTQGTNIAELQQSLVDVTMNYCPQMKMKIPLLWLKLEESIVTARNKHKTNIIDWEKIQEFSQENGINDEKDIKLAVQFLDDLGIVQYFDTEVLNDKVVINPQWIVDVMAKVVSVNETSIRETKGRLYHKYIPQIWKDYDSSLYNWMLRLTEAFDLTFPISEEGEKINIVPCLLPEKEPVDLPWPYLTEEEGIRESKIEYKFTYLPTGLFNRAQARLFSQGFKTDQEFLDLMWKRGSILKKNDHYALVKQTNDYDMTVIVQGARPKNILDLIHETISTLIKDNFAGVAYDYCIPCPDCVEKKGTREPFLFKADLITRANSVSAPFLQCTKYFHTVSIGELINVLPDNRDTEFDVQMQQSISALQEISTNMAKDVAILYCPDDLPTSENKGKIVDPRQIHKDLVKQKISCWIPDDIDKIPELEMTMEIKNSKVLVVCMTDKFVKHPKCHQMFLYATEQLQKPFAVAVMDESLAWQQTNIGFKIGNPLMAMIKNVERYPKKILDLIEIVKSYIEDAEKVDSNHPSVFLSYCWSNCKEACSVTTTATKTSLGYGDPRVLKRHLEKNGCKSWLDIEQMGKNGLYQDITVGLQNAKVLVLCVSDEYLRSEACMMEARFGAYNLQMPMVVCVVGTGKAWKLSEVSLMISKQGDMATVVKMQKKNSGAYDQVLECVKKYLLRPETAKQKKVREKLAKLQAKQDKMKLEDMENELRQQGDNRFSFQEEVELIQRKFLRHISKMIRGDGSELPKLLVLDFVTVDEDDNEQNVMDDMGSQGSLGGGFSSFNLFSQRPKSSKPKRKQIKDDWHEEQFCIRALCEDEQGWHLVGNPLSLTNLKKDEIMKTLKETAPYLARIYAILKQSSVSMNCLSSSVKGELFMDFIRKEGIDTKNFSDAYKTIHRIVAEHDDYEQFINQLNRCYLQTGKISWLCTTHHDRTGITLLPPGTVSMHSSGYTVLYDEDIMLSDFLKASKDYLKWKDEDFLLARRQSKDRLVKKDNALKEIKKESLPKVEESKKEPEKINAEKPKEKPENKNQNQSSPQKTSPASRTNGNEQKQTSVQRPAPASTVNRNEQNQTSVQRPTPASTVNRNEQKQTSVQRPTPASTVNRNEQNQTSVQRPAPASTVNRNGLKQADVKGSNTSKFVLPRDSDILHGYGTLYKVPEHLVNIRYETEFKLGECIDYRRRVFHVELAHEPISVGSTCPWYYRKNIDENRLPNLMYDVECICANCIGQRSGRTCQKIYTYINVFRRIGCLNGIYDYSTIVEPISVGCSCVRDPKPIGRQTMHS